MTDISGGKKLAQNSYVHTMHARNFALHALDLVEFCHALQTGQPLTMVVRASFPH